MFLATAITAGLLLGAGSTTTEPIEPLAASMVELFLSTEGGTSSCGAYAAAGSVGALTGDPANSVMMQDMAEAYLFVQFETIMSDQFGATYRMTDEARDLYHTYLTAC